MAYVLLALTCGLAVYFFLEWRKADGARAAGLQETAAARAKLEGLDALRAERDSAIAAREAAQDETARAVARIAALESAAHEREFASAEREQALMQMKQEVERSFEALAAQALAANQQSFLTLANETFAHHQTSAAGSVKEVVGPVQEQFAKLSETIQAIETARLQDRSALGEQMRAIGDTLKETQVVTSKLTQALRAAPKTRGRWGEEALKNVLELAGLTARIDYETEDAVKTEDGAIRPDVTIRLPGGRCIVVDAKVALSGYLDAMEAADEAAREAHLRKHAGELRQHATKLGGKEYWRHIQATADFVIMFVPGDNFIAAAFERDPSLHEDSMRNRVIIVGPSSLLALARSIAYGWRQEEMARNAEQIATLGRELFQRLSKLSGVMGEVGGALEKSMKKYNEMVGSFDTRVLVTARKFRDLGADDGEEIAEIKPTETAARLPAPQGELALDDPKPAPRKG
jgi:DNA recombination protein RmuC